METFFDEGQVINSIRFLPVVLGLIVITAVVACKYLQNPGLLLLTVVVASLLYKRDMNRKNMQTGNFEETLISVAKFIIVTGISGYVAARVVGFFFPGFD